MANVWSRECWLGASIRTALQIIPLADLVEPAAL
jgi:hypothetical protein